MFKSATHHKSEGLIAHLRLIAGNYYLVFCSKILFRIIICKSTSKSRQGLDSEHNRIVEKSDLNYISGKIIL